MNNEAFGLKHTGRGAVVFRVAGDDYTESPADTRTINDLALKAHTLVNQGGWIFSPLCNVIGWECAREAGADE